MPQRANNKKKNSVSLARGKPKNGTVVDFNPDQRVDFITGFRKRKNERRKVAGEALLLKAKEDRIEERKRIRDEVQKVRQEKKGLKDSIRLGFQEKIFFAGEVKGVSDVFQSPSEQSGRSEANMIPAKQKKTDYQVNNQFVSVTTKSIDLLEKELEIEPAFVPIRPDSESEDEEEIDIRNRPDDIRTITPVFEWSEGNGEWQEFSAPAKPERIPEHTTMTTITCNVWNSDKWQEARTTALLHVLHQHKASFVCLQEVGRYLLTKIEQNDWIKRFYCVTDVFGDGLVENEFVQVILISKELAHSSLTMVKKFPFSRTITGRTALFAYLKDFVIVNVHLEGLSNERIRMEQIKELVLFLEGENNVALLGDFGAMGTELGRHSLLLEESEISDIWEDMSMEDEGWTFDQEMIVDMLSTKQRKKKKKTKARFDRIFMKSSELDWRPTDIEIIGTAPLTQYRESIFISTHAALLGTFSNEPNSLMMIPPPEEEEDEEPEEEAEDNGQPPKKKQKRN